MADQQPDESVHYGSDYISLFQPRIYLNQCYSDLSKETEESLGFLKFKMDKLNSIFKSGTICGKKLLDIGCGPTIQTTIPAFKYFDEVYLSDYCPQNLDNIKLWLTKEPEAHNWTPFFRYNSELDGKGSDVAVQEETYRRKIKELLPCDVRLKNPLHPHQHCQFDAIVTSLALEVASMDLVQYNSSVINVASLLKEGGHLVIVGVQNEHSYKHGDVKFFTLAIQKDNICAALTNAGLQVVNWFDEVTNPYNDITPYVAVARKFCSNNK